MAAGTRRSPISAPGVRAIFVYKAGKALAQAVLAVVLAVLLARGLLTEAVHDVAPAVRLVLPGMWSVHLAERLVRVATRGHLTLTAAALAFDAGLCALEAWALWRGRWWGPWLVVVATSALIPFEVFELFRRPQAARAGAPRAQRGGGRLPRATRARGASRARAVKASLARSPARPRASGPARRACRRCSTRGSSPCPRPSRACRRSPGCSSLPP